MMPPDVVQGLAALAERYMNSGPLCFLCHDAPGVAALAFLADGVQGGKGQGCVFALCMVCLCGEDMEARVQGALRAERARVVALWN
jgi:hypothetical protein